ncbi:MAG: hypothetical protein IPM46_01290 [Flavobacteriales bacterium]|nr:hypothetical protein [Flavobacteriales bacterium]
MSGGPGFDAIIDVRSGACDGTNIGCADATVGGGVEVVSLTGLTESDTYYVRVYGWAGGTGNSPSACSSLTATATTMVPASGTACDDGDANGHRLHRWQLRCEGVACTTDLDFVYQADGNDDLTWAIYEQGNLTDAKSGGGGPSATAARRPACLMAASTSW